MSCSALLLLLELFELTLASVIMLIEEFLSFYSLEFNCCVSFFFFRSFNKSNLFGVAVGTNCKCVSVNHPFVILAYFREWDNNYSLVIRQWPCGKNPHCALLPDQCANCKFA